MHAARRNMQRDVLKMPVSQCKMLLEVSMWEPVIYALLFMFPSNAQKKAASNRKKGTPHVVMPAKAESIFCVGLPGLFTSFSLASTCQPYMPCLYAMPYLILVSPNAVCQARDVASFRYIFALAGIQN